MAVPEETEEREVLYSERIMRRAPAAEPPAVDTNAPFEHVVMQVIDEMQGAADAMARKLQALQVEIDILKADRSFEKYTAKLDESIRKCDELIGRFDRGHERSGQVIDLPSLPRATRNVN
jgi:hypothetical protein